MPIPDPLKLIAADVLSGKARRAKVRTLMGWYGLKKRREAGLTAIRTDLTALGITCTPEFESAGFDDQVKFVRMGEEADTSADFEPTESKSYKLEFEPAVSAKGRVRVFLRTYDAFERFRASVISDRLAKILQNGQNARREDRDLFPFYAVIELASSATEGDVEEWLAEAARLDPAESTSIEPAEVKELAIDLDDLKRHLSDLNEALRADFGRQVLELKQAMDEKVDEVRLEAIRKLAKELNDEEALKVIQEFEEETKEKLAVQVRELNEAYSEINLLNAQIQDLVESLRERDEYDPTDAYPTMSATVRLFSDLCEGSPIVVHDNAMRSAQRSASTRRREVLQFLLVLRDLADGIYSRGGIGKPFREWFAERGYEYAQGDSQTGATRFGQERDIQLRGSKIQMEEHVTLFPNTQNCLTVYFYRDDAERQLVVGYVGPHLRTANSR